VGKTVLSWSRSCRGWIWAEEGWTMGRMGRAENELEGTWWINIKGWAWRTLVPQAPGCYKLDGEL
jgi:hypothetical protein